MLTNTASTINNNSMVGSSSNPSEINTMTNIPSFVDSNINTAIQPHEIIPLNNILHHPLYPSLLSSQALILTDGHKHYKQEKRNTDNASDNDQEEGNTNNNEGTTTTVNNNTQTSNNGNQNNNMVPLEVTIGTAGNENDPSLVNQLFSNYLRESQEITGIKEESNNDGGVVVDQEDLMTDDLLVTMSAMYSLQKTQIQTFYQLCEDYIDQLQHALSIDKTNAKLNAKQRTLIQNQLNSNGQSPEMDNDDFPISEIKKTEDVVKELKKRYSGEVLNLAKKKKNFPKHATDVLNMWFFQHLHDPYPSDQEKQLLSQQTGLSLSQVNNWFGNKRMRYKRKMLEQNRKNGGKGGSGNEGNSPTQGGQQYQFHNNSDGEFIDFR
ncbi:hypothetical protein ABK040_008415 [Willaertia magna]